MKDKEMAREYAVQFGFGSDCNNITSHDANEAIAQAFFVGLREGRREKWHDLRKDPNDLPILETELLCQKSSGRCFVGYYKHTDEKFHSYETGKSYDIVRWMDIGIWWNIPKV